MPHGERSLDPTDELWRGRGSSVGDIANTRGVALGEVWRVQDPHHHGGDTAEGRDLLALDELEGSLRVKVMHHHEPASGGRVDDQDGLAAGGVEERHREQVTVGPRAPTVLAGPQGRA